MKKLLAILFLAAIAAQAGTVLNILNTSGQMVWMVKPQCKLQVSDTCGPIQTQYCKYFSVDFKGKRVSHKDTALVDSGFKVRLYSSYNTSSANMSTPDCADSTLSFFDIDSFAVRKNGTTGLSIPVAPYYWLVFTRYDSNADTLDFKKSTGTIDTVFTFQGYKER